MSQTIFPQPNPELLLTQGVLTRRLLAFAVDMIILSIASAAAVFGIAVFGIFTLGLGWLAFHIVPWLPLLYFTLLVGGEGATPGQLLFGLRVRQELDLSRPTMAQGLVWTLLLFVSFACGGVPFRLALLGPRHRTAHDMLSGLVIIRQPQISY